MCFIFPETGASDWCGEYKRKTSERVEKPGAKKEEMDRVVGAYIAGFKRRLKREPVLVAKDYANAKRLINSLGVDKAVEVMVGFWNDIPDWNRKNAVYGLSSVCSSANSIKPKEKSDDVMEFLEQQVGIHKDDELFKTAKWFQYVDYVKKSGNQIHFLDWLRGE